jgi:hypothetical protein
MIFGHEPLSGTKPTQSRRKQEKWLFDVVKAYDLLRLPTTPLATTIRVNNTFGVMTCARAFLASFS